MSKNHLAQWQFDTLELLPYSLDINFPDFNHYVKMKKPFQGKQFHHRGNIQKGIKVISCRCEEKPTGKNPPLPSILLTECCLLSWASLICNTFIIPDPYCYVGFNITYPQEVKYKNKSPRY